MSGPWRGRLKAGAAAAALALCWSGAAPSATPGDAAMDALRHRLVGRGSLDGLRVVAMRRAGPCGVVFDLQGARPLRLDWRDVGDVSQSGLIGRHGVALLDGRGARVHVVQLPDAREADLAEASMTVIAEACAAGRR